MWVVVSEAAETPFKDGGGKAVFAEGTAERAPIAVGALETSFGTSESRRARGMGEKGEDIAV